MRSVLIFHTVTAVGKLHSVENRDLGLVHTFRLSTGRQVPITARQSSGTQESTGVFTHAGRLAGREFTGRLRGRAWIYPLHCRIYPLQCPVAGRSTSQQWCMFCLWPRSHTPVFNGLYPSNNVPLQCQWSTETVVFQW